MRSLGRQVVLASVVFTLVGCGGGGPPVGMPEDKTFTPAPTADFMKGGAMAPKTIPKPGMSSSDTGAAPATK